MTTPSGISGLVAILCGDRYGLLFLANALDSVREGLVDGRLVRDLLADLSDEMNAKPTDKWPHALDRVCRGKAGVSSVRSTNGYVRTTNLPAHASHAAVFWTTVVSATVWVEFHLDKSKPSTKALPKFPPGRDPAFQQKFDSLVSQPDWFAPPTDNGGAWLGRPAQDGANCWVSCTEINADFQLPSDSLNGSARRVVEALGLMPTTPFDSYVRYEVDAAQLRSTATRDACRPSFADLGNAWFRVSTCTPRAKHYASHGWGSTVDLSAVRARESDDTGHPERVAASIPINAETVKKPEWLASQPGDHQFSSHPTAQFDSTLFSGRSPSDIETAVLELWHNIPSVP